MHGIIFTELRKYVDEKLGGDAWSELLNSAGLSGRMYLPIQEYPDSEAVALVTTASRITGLDAGTILERFGEFIAPSLLGMYRTLVKPEWKTLDLVENTEGTIHTVVRARNPGAKPPELKAVRLSPTELKLTYGSQRKLCHVAKGIVKGMAAHFGEQVSLVETQCMHKGANTCEMVIAVAAASVGVGAGNGVRQEPSARPVAMAVSRESVMKATSSADTGASARPKAKLKSSTAPQGKAVPTPMTASKPPANAAPRTKGKRTMKNAPKSKKAAPKAAKKAAPKRAAAKKSVRKAAPKKAAPKLRVIAKSKVAAEKKTVRKAAPKKSTAKKAAPKKSTAKKVVRKAAPKKSTAKKVVRKAAPKKAVARKAAPKKTVRKAAPKKSVAKKAAPKKAVARKPAKRRTAPKAAARPKLKVVPGNLRKAS